LDPNDDRTLPDGPFDYTLVDVPCSNTGVLGRRPEVRWRLRPEELPHLVRLQRRLLELAEARLRDGGVLVYSTCSIEPEENQAVANSLPSDFHCEVEESSVPGISTDGGYWSQLRKTSEVAQ
jgi:16S rRNA (cytosine967-C5)-methyltransferase